MRVRTVRAIALKDVAAIRGNIQVWLPMIIVPLMLGVLMPGGLLAALLYLDAEDLSEMQQVLERLPEGLLPAGLASLADPEQMFAFFIANYLLAAFFLLIPIMAVSTVTADSFAGEKERGTLEGLLFSPASLLELFVGKSLAAFLVGMGLTLGTFALTLVSVNAVGWASFGRAFFPTVNWLPLLGLVIPLLSTGVILTNVFISARVMTFQAAYQFGGVMVLPVLGLVVGQFTGIMLLSVGVIIGIAAALLVVDALLLLILVRALDRPQLFESQVR